SHGLAHILARQFHVLGIPGCMGYQKLRRRIQTSDLLNVSPSLIGVQVLVIFRRRFRDVLVLPLQNIGDLVFFWR
ncbi:MAG: hypothetical protein HQL63_12495, partial [Magnetococcales bacterium]|nr:hypothetical protein [Magnetococcales bacterium]